MKKLESKTQWFRAAAKVPKDRRIVLVHIPSADGDRAWPGRHDGERWVWLDGSTIIHPVTHWADLPEPPTK